MTPHPPTGEPGLEACPFCGGEANRIKSKAREPEASLIECKKCEYAFIGKPGVTAGEMAEKWNHRAAPPSPVPVALPDDVAGDVARVKQGFAMATELPDHEDVQLQDFEEAAHRIALTVQSQSSTIAGLMEEVERLKREAPEARCKNFNETSGAIYGGNVHPDRCVCQGTDPTPHRHYREWPFSCARCGHKNCAAYRPALKPVARGDGT